MADSGRPIPPFGLCQSAALQTLRSQQQPSGLDSLRSWRWNRGAGLEDHGFTGPPIAQA
jgi:hypothetical protein